MRRDDLTLSPADHRSLKNGYGHPGWPMPTFPVGQEHVYDPDSAVVTVTEPGVYRVKWDVGTNRFKLVPIELPF